MGKMASFVALQTGVTVGSKAELTVDLFTAVGVLVLANKDQKRLDADLAEVRRMEIEGLFTFDEDMVDPAQQLGKSLDEDNDGTVLPTSGENSTDDDESYDGDTESLGGEKELQDMGH